MSGLRSWQRNPIKLRKRTPPTSREEWVDKQQDSNFEVFVIFFSIQNHHRASQHSDIIPHIAFDYHSEIKSSPKNIQKLRDRIRKQLQSFDFFHADGETITQYVKEYEL